ncbi:unnamed protein product [Brassica oleracea]
MTRNHVGFARAGSNPAVHDFKILFSFIRVYTDSDLIALKALEKENPKCHELQRNMHLKRMQEWNLLLEKRKSSHISKVL